MNCPRCNKTLPETAAFCTGCGLRIGAKVAPQQPQAAAPPPVPALPPLTGMPKLQNTRTVNWSLPHPGAPRQEFTIYSTPETPERRRYKFNPATGVVIFVIVIAGYFGFYFLSSGTHGKPFSGTFKNEEFGFGLVLPEGWNVVDKPAAETRFSNTVGFFYKGGGRSPEVKMAVFYDMGDENVPTVFSDAQLEFLEPMLKNYMKQFKNNMGLKYDFLALHTYVINGRDALWIEGNQYKKDGGKPMRDFTFFTFHESKLYLITFTFEEAKTKLLWPEIEQILRSFSLY